MDYLREFLLYHVIPQRTLTTEFQAGRVDTLATDAQVTVGIGPTTFDGSKVTIIKDQGACNGVFNVLNTVLDVRNAK